MLWYSLEAPHQDASDEYPQHMFALWNKKNILMLLFIWSYALLSTEFLLLFLHQNISGGCSLVLCWAISIEYPQDVFICTSNKILT